MIPLKAHNVFEYVFGAFLIVAPWIFDFAEIPAARTLFLVSGLCLIAYSLLTNYYYSVVKILPLGVHMTLDALLGVTMILAPLLFGYRERLGGLQYSVHIVVGVAALGLVALTKPKTEATKTPSEQAEIMFQ